MEYFQDDQKRLPFTEEDFIIKDECATKSSNLLLDKFNLDSDAGRNDIVQMLPEILKLKGSDGQPLVGENHFAQILETSIAGIKDLKDFQTLLDTIKDDKGNLPFSRDVFDVSNSKDETENGSNKLLKNLYSSYQYSKRTMEIMKSLKVDTTSLDYGPCADNLLSEEYCLGVIPILMSLKDKDGKPIISKENIDKFPQNNPLTPVVKAYAKSQDKPTLREFISTQQGTKSANLPSRSDVLNAVGKQH